MQLRLAWTPIVPGTAAIFEALAQRGGWSPAVRLALTGNLGGYYIHENQPSLAIARLLECRALAPHDSASRREAATWLSYCYGLLRQPRPGLAFGREALRFTTGRGEARQEQLSGIYNNLALCATLLADYRLAEGYYRQCLALNKARRDSGDVAVTWGNLAELALKQQQPTRAGQWLDSAVAAYAGAAPAIRLYLNQLAGTVAAQRHRYPAAVAVLEPARRQAHALRLLNQEGELLQQLVPALAALGRHREALQRQLRLSELQDSLFEQNSQRHAQELKVLYETQQQQARIGQLQALARQRADELRQRTLLFGGLLLGLAAAAVLLARAWRARQRRQRLAREAALRTRIAADLHDEVGTLLARVSMQADLLNTQQPGENPSLTRLLGDSRAAARTMRDIVWSIDAQADTMGALLDRMRDHLDQTAGPAGLRTHLHTEHLPDELPLPADLRQHLYLVFKEAVTNALRHATHPTQVGVTLARHPARRTLELTVEDDGQPGPPPARSGMGLRNMRQRAAALGGKLEVGPRPAGGFGVRLYVPLGELAD